MKIVYYLLSFWLSVSPLFASAQSQVFTDLPLAYRVRQSTTITSHAPLILLLHGYGSNEADLISLADRLPENFTVVSARAPIAMGNDRYQWFKMELQNGTQQANDADLDSSSAKVTAFLKAVAKKYDADSNQLYLSGFSQGGMMSFEVGLRHPALLRGIAPLSGKIFPSLKAKIDNRAALKRLAIFIGHGTADDRVGYHFATAANNYLKQLGLNPEFHSYDGLRHSISSVEIADLSKWLRNNQ